MFHANRLIFVNSLPISITELEPLDFRKTGQKLSTEAMLEFSSKCEKCQLVGYDENFVERKLRTQYENTFRTVIASYKIITML